MAFPVFGAQSPQDPRAVFLAFDEARPVLERLAHLLPADLKALDPATLRNAWPAWTVRRDAEIRSRLGQGDEDSLVNLLLFGTSFTTQPRLTAQQLDVFMKAADAPGGATLDRVTMSRINDLLAAASRPGANDRFSFVRRFFEEKGYALDTAGGRSQARTHMLAALARVLKEIVFYDQVIQQTERLADPSAQFAERSKLYRARGLASDSSLRPGFAIEEALKAAQAKGLLEGRVRRVAILGPGLDYADKQEGYDFYPPQTLQPFAVVDSLVRLGLATRESVAVTTFDLSPRVNAHLTDLKARSLRGQPYVVQLPLDASERWRPEFLRYWSVFGDRVGAPEKPAAVPANAGSLKLRAVRILPEVGSLFAPVDLNVVLQRLDLPAEERFDLIVGTNVFVYYDEFQQALAMANIERMLRPGGLLLSNNALVELPGSRLRSVGHSTVAYSERGADADVVVWYQRR